MISMLTPLPIGNAVKVTLLPPRGSTLTRLLRNDSGEFSGADDSSALVVFEGNERSILDDIGLVNGQRYHYCPFYLSGFEWTGADPGSVIPQATYVDRSVDAMTVILDRIAAGLRVEVDRGLLQHESGAIPVLSAPPVFSETRWPVVTVHLQQEASASRGLGELIEVDERDDEDWTESEGWRARSQITVIAWSLNPDERITLRKALRRLIVGNLEVFDANAMTEIDLSMQDIEDFTSYNAPVYQAMATITCVAPVLVSGKVGDISDVNTVVTVEIQ